MPAYNKFSSFVKNLAEKQYNEATDTLIVALCAAANAPVASNVKLSDLTQIAYTNLSSRTLTVASSSQVAGLYKLIVNNLTLTASGAVATFRYIVIYDSSAVNQELICWFDYGQDLTLSNSGDAMLISFDQTNGLFTIQ